MGEPPEQEGDRAMSADRSTARRADTQKIDAIATSLRRAYSDAVAEDVPDVLMDLLNKLR
jgi:hypothetical protein